MTVSTELVVHVNRDRPKTVDVAPSPFEPTGPFDVVLYNHGQAAHVHLALDETLDSYVSLPSSNYFVDTEEVAHVTVDVGVAPEGTSGTLSVVTGYGAAEATAEIILTPSAGEPVLVDDRLGKPSPREPVRERGIESFLTTETVMLAAVGVVVLIASVATGIVTESPIAALGVLALLGACAIVLARIA